VTTFMKGDLYAYEDGRVFMCMGWEGAHHIQEEYEVDVPAPIDYTFKQKPIYRLPQYIPPYYGHGMYPPHSIDGDTGFFRSAPRRPQTVKEKRTRDVFVPTKYTMCNVANMEVSIYNTTTGFTLVVNPNKISIEEMESRIAEKALATAKAAEISKRKSQHADLRAQLQALISKTTTLSYATQRELESNKATLLKLEDELATYRKQLQGVEEDERADDADYKKTPETVRPHESRKRLREEEVRLVDTDSEDDL